MRGSDGPSKALTCAALVASTSTGGDRQCAGDVPVSYPLLGTGLYTRTVSRTRARLQVRGTFRTSSVTEALRDRPGTGPITAGLQRVVPTPPPNSMMAARRYGRGNPERLAASDAVPARLASLRAVGKESLLSPSKCRSGVRCRSHLPRAYDRSRPTSLPRRFW